MASACCPGPERFGQSSLPQHSCLPIHSQGSTADAPCSSLLLGHPPLGPLHSALSMLASATAAGEPVAPSRASSTSLAASRPHSNPLAHSSDYSSIWSRSSLSHTSNRPSQSRASTIEQEKYLLDSLLNFSAGSVGLSCRGLASIRLSNSSLPSAALPLLPL